jgi:hypothetical protein
MKKKHITQVWACNHHHQFYNTSAYCDPRTLQGELWVFKIQEFFFIIYQKNFTPLLELGGPWEGLGTETPFPSIHNLGQSMASRLHLI